MKRRLTLCAIGSLVLVAAWFFLFHQPAAVEQTKLSAEIESARAKLTDYQTTVADLPNVLAQQEQLRSSRTELESSLYAKEDILKLFDELDTHVRAHHLRINEISPPLSELVALNDRMQQPGEPLFLNIRLVIHGDYINFGRYVRELEAKPYFRGVNRCIVQSGQAASDPTICTIDFKALLGSTEAAS